MVVVDSEIRQQDSVAQWIEQFIIINTLNCPSWRRIVSGPSSLVNATEILVKLSLYGDSAAYCFPEYACYQLTSYARREGDGPANLSTACFCHL